MTELEPLEPYVEEESEPVDRRPHNLDAEQAFLGALLFDNPLYFRVAEFLRPEHFFDPVHGRIYEAATDMISSNALADAVTLKTHFEGDDGLKEIGGATYLAVLVESGVEPAAAYEYARMVYALSLRRELISIGEGCVHSAGTEGDMTPADIIEEVEQRLSELATEATTNRVSYVHTAADRVMGEIEGNKGVAITTGISDLDRALAGGLRPSKLYVPAGRPGMAKTVLALSMQLGACEAGYCAPMFQYEMDDDEVAERTLSLYASRERKIAGVDRPTYEEIARWRVTDGEKPNIYQAQALQRARQKLAEAKTHVPIIDAAGMTVPAIMAVARRIFRKAERQGIKRGPIFVDYIQLVSAHTNRGSNLTGEVTDIANALKQMAKTLKVPVVALSQLSRGVESREDKRPRMSDLRESGAIEQNADGVLMLYRDAYYAKDEKCPAGADEAKLWQARCEDTTLEVLIRKLRGGRTGVVKLYTDVSRNIVSNRAEDWTQTGVAA